MKVSYPPPRSLLEKEEPQGEIPGLLGSFNRCSSTLLPLPFRSPQQLIFTEVSTGKEKKKTKSR